MNQIFIANSKSVGRNFFACARAASLIIIIPMVNWTMATLFDVLPLLQQLKNGRLEPAVYVNFVGVEVYTANTFIILICYNLVMMCAGSYIITSTGTLLMFFFVNINLLSQLICIEIESFDCELRGRKEHRQRLLKIAQMNEMYIRSCES